jgi:hypothetical protein
MKHISLFALCIVLLILIVPILNKEGYDEYLNYLLQSNGYAGVKRPVDTHDYRESARLSSELYCKDGSLKMDHILANCSLNLSPTRAVKDVSGGRELAAGNPCKNDSQCYSRNCDRGVCGEGEPAAAGLTGFYYRYLDLFRPVL